MVNIQAFFSQVDIAGAAGWTYLYYDEGDPSVVKKASNNPTYFVGEVNFAIHLNWTAH